MRSPMLTFSHLPTFHGTPPDGVWHQQGSLARYVKNGVAAVVDVNGRVTILPSCLDLVVAYRDTLPECFAWAEGEVERLVGDLATFEELCSYKHWTTQHMPLHPDVEKLLTGDVLRAELGKAAARQPGFAFNASRDRERATPTIQGNYRVVDSIEWSPVNEWHFSRDYPQWLHLRACGKTHIVRGAPDGYNTVISHHAGLTYPTQHEAMAAVLAAAYPVDREVAYVGTYGTRPEGWSMRVEEPGVWRLRRDGLLAGHVSLGDDGRYLASRCRKDFATFTEAADAAEGAAKVSTVQAQRDLRERNHKAISAARLKDVHTNGGWKPPGDAGGGDALREVGGGRQRILVNNDGRVSLIDTSVPGGYSKLDFETAEEVLAAADEQVASKTGYAPVISLVDLKPGDTIRHKGGGDALVVTANYGNRVTAVRTADVTNPCEWQVWREK